MSGSGVDMDEMLCNKNAIYVSSASYRYGEMDMINLFGSPAGRAINEITSIKLNRSEQEGGKPSHLSSNSNVDKQKTNIRNEFVQLNLTKFNQSTNTNKTSTWGAVSNASLLAKKVKFWKYFEENKQKSSNGSSIAANSTAMHCNSVTRNSSSWWRQKSTADLYRDAVQILGMSCTLSDSCRCLDCQSGYFDFVDSDTYSESYLSANEDDDFGSDDIDDEYDTRQMDKIPAKKTSSTSLSLSDLYLSDESDK